MNENLTKVINKIKDNYCPAKEDIEFILQNRNEAEEYFVAVLKEVVKWEIVPDKRSDLFMHAVFLLGALQSEKGLPVLAKILAKDEKFIDDFFGDILTECLFWALSEMGKNKPQILYKIARDNRREMFVRVETVRALSRICCAQPEKRKKIIPYFRKLLKICEKLSEPNWTGWLVDSIADIAPIELKKKIDDLFNRGQIDLGVINYSDMEKLYNHPNEYLLRIKDDIFTIYQHYGWLIAWNDPIVGGSKRYRENKKSDDENSIDKEFVFKPIRTEPKIGRNEKCPCGSGKKYKKCCLNKQ